MPGEDGGDIAEADGRREDLRPVDAGVGEEFDGSGEVVQFVIVGATDGAPVADQPPRVNGHVGAGCPRSPPARRYCRCQGN